MLAGIKLCPDQALIGFMSALLVNVFFPGPAKGQNNIAAVFFEQNLASYGQVFKSGDSVPFQFYFWISLFNCCDGDLPHVHSGKSSISYSNSHFISLPNTFLKQTGETTSRISWPCLDLWGTTMAPLKALFIRTG